MSELSITLHFSSKAKLSAFKRNMAKGKGTVIKPSVASIDAEGDGLFSKIASKIVAPVAGKVISKVTGSKLAGKIAETGIDTVGGNIKRVRGKGFDKILKDIGHAVTDGVNKAKPLVNKGIRATKNIKLGGSFAPLGGGIGQVVASQVQTGIGPASLNFSTPAERMAWVRSHRKALNGMRQG